MSRGPCSYVLAFTAGSSSLRFELFERRSGWRSRARGAVRDIGRSGSRLDLGAAESEIIPIPTHADAAGLVLDRLLALSITPGLSASRIAAIGHRVVHGGDTFREPVRITPSVIQALGSLAHLAPLHNPPSLAVMGTVRERLANAPQAAVFDTAFFADMPDYARRYAIPEAWYAEHGIRRFGFHGLAHDYMSKRLTRLSGRKRPRRVVTLHLGQGCSATALDNGRPIETSMGFTPLEGLIMGTRSGDLDVGAVLYLARLGYSWQELENDLNRVSGLRGLSGTSSDVRELQALEDRGDADAALALSAFCHRVRKYVGAYAVALGGLDALVFGGGIGENAPRLRARICAGLEWLGLEFDDAANARCVGVEDRISTADSSIDARVVPVREEEAIARAALTCVVCGAVADRTEQS